MSICAQAYKMHVSEALCCQEMADKSSPLLDLHVCRGRQGIEDQELEKQQNQVDKLRQLQNPQVQRKPSRQTLEDQELEKQRNQVDKLGGIVSMLIVAVKASKIKSSRNNKAK